MATKTCIASKTDIANDKGAVTFPCPSCGAPITRSSNARKIVRKYTCESCKFTGPN